MNLNYKNFQQKKTYNLFQREWINKLINRRIMLLIDSERSSF